MVKSYTVCKYIFFNLVLDMRDTSELMTFCENKRIMKDEIREIYC